MRSQSYAAQIGESVISLLLDAQNKLIEGDTKEDNDLKKAQDNFNNLVQSNPSVNQECLDSIAQFNPINMRSTTYMPCVNNVIKTTTDSTTTFHAKLQQIKSECRNVRVCKSHFIFYLYFIYIKCLIR